MGFSIAAPIKSERDLWEMMAFLNREFRPFTKLAKKTPLKSWYNVGSLTYNVPNKPEGLSYSDGKLRIGFNCSGGGPGRAYLWSMCCWIAAKVGRRRRWKGTTKACYYIVYDDIETIRVLLNGDSEAELIDAGLSYIDEKGWHPTERQPEFQREINLNDTPEWQAVRKRWLEGEDLQADQTDAIVKQEIYRLDAAWLKFVAERSNA